MKGVVVKSTGGWYEVRADNAQIYPCRLRGKFRIQGIKNTNPVVVGDHVSLILEKDGSGFITEIEKRKNYIDRKSTKLSKISHLIAANIDMAFLVVTIRNPRTSLGFIDRFLVAAEGFRIPVTLVINKMDLYNESDLVQVEQWTSLYKNIGYDVIYASVLENRGIDLIADKMKGMVSLFSGHSGVGKSAIINAIDPSLNLKIGEISSCHEKGKHTTTFAEMYDLQNGASIIDTPGLKEFGLIQYSKEEIRDFFPEIRDYNNKCRFNNCLHLHEPDCEVVKAVNEGRIASSRYENYLSIILDSDMKIEDWKLR